MTNKNSLIIIGILAVVILAVVVVVKGFSIRSVNPDDMTRGESEPAAVDSAELAQRYRAQLAVIMPRYLSVLETAAHDDIAAVHDDLLALTNIPSDYLDAHVRLVLLLDSLADGASPAAARVSFTELTGEYDWLANYGSDVE